MAGVVEVSFCLFLECEEAVRWCGVRPTQVARVCMHDRVLLVGPCYEPKGDVLGGVCADDGRTHFAARQDQRSRGRQPRSNQKALPHVCGVAVTEARLRPSES